MASLDETQDRAIRDDKLRLLRALIPGLAHEINNSNQTTLLTAQILLDVWKGIKQITDRYYADHGDYTVGGIKYSTIKEELPDYLANVLHSAERIEKIVSELTAFCRSEITSEQQPVDLNRLVDSAITLLANPIRKSTNNFSVDLAPDLPQIMGNPQILSQSILNLILNACQALRDRKNSIYISTRYEDKDNIAVCEVKDEGRGVAPELMKRIRAIDVNTQPFPADIGRGLSAVLRIVIQHGGSFELQSEADQGTRAIIRLPVST